jgi:serine/threonine-protein kinase
MNDQFTTMSSEPPLDGRYALERRLGGGGMADVYLAEDLILRRQVAIKILKPHLAADDDLVERFRIEAQAAAQLNHPNIVTVYDRGATDWCTYIVMEYVRGETVKQRLRRTGRFNCEDAVRITLSVLAALGAAHARRIVHRDVTAANVLIDEAGRVKVTDFGIARIGAPSLTKTGTVLGTSSYVSPEQAQGRPADERSDLYSAAVVLYEMLTGRLPFSGDSDVAVALQHVAAPPPDLQALAPEVPGPLAAVVIKALSKRPDDRYQSAAEFAAALRHAQESDSTTVMPVQTEAPPPFAPAAERRVAWPSVVPEQPATALTTASATDEAATVLGVAPGQAEQVWQPDVEPEHTASLQGPVRRGRGRWLALILALALVGLGAWALVVFFVDTGPRVPAVIGRDEAAAVAAVKAEGLKAATREVWADGAAVGTVARQRPAAGTRVDEGARIDLWISRGALHLPAPRLVGKSADEAADALAQESLGGKARKSASDQAPEGQVFRQKPAAGTQVARGDTVTYWVSTGPPLVAVPDVVGLQSSAAVSTLEDQGFAASIDYVLGWGKYPNEVVDQDPAAGTRLRKGDEVVIKVAVF